MILSFIIDPIYWGWLYALTIETETNMKAIACLVRAVPHYYSLSRTCDDFSIVNQSIRPFCSQVMCVLATASAALDGHKSPKTIIECPNRASFDYIRSELKSSSDTVSLTFRNCYLTGFDFSFLVNYPNLESIEVVGGSLEEFVSMPFTPSLKAVSLDLPDFRRWHDPSMTPNIENITFTPRPYPGESAIEAIFAPLFYYHKTLRFLRLPDGEWTAVPSIVGSFTNLTEFYMVGFNLTVLKSGSFGPSNPRTITIEPCGLEIIEPGAFQGKIFLIRFMSGSSCASVSFIGSQETLAMSP